MGISRECPPLKDRLSLLRLILNILKKLLKYVSLATSGDTLTAQIQFLIISSVFRDQIKWIILMVDLGSYFNFCF